MEVKSKFFGGVQSAVLHFFLYCATLIYLELLLRFNITEGVTSQFVWFLCFVPVQAMVLTVLSGLFRGRKNAIVSAVLLIILTFYYIAQLIYYKNFGSLFSVSMVGMGAEALKNFGWAILDTVKDNIIWIFLMCFPAYIVSGIIKYAPVARVPFGIAWRCALLLLLVPAWMLGVLVTRLDGDGRQSAYVVLCDSLSNTDITSAHLGALTTTMLECGGSFLGVQSKDAISLVEVDTDVLQQIEEETSQAAMEPDMEQNVEIKKPKRENQVFEELDFQQLAEATDDKNLKELSKYLGSRMVSTTNEYTGIFEGYNLIYICAEAFWSYAIDEKLTPTLYKMSNQGIILNNYYNSFKNTTTNGEFAFATSLWPDLSRIADAGTDVGSFYQSATCYMPLGLGDFFCAKGVPSYAFHNYYGTYYRRILSWPNLGYTCKFYKSGMEFTSSWPSSDLEMMEQSVGDYIDNERFHAYYMTFSGHGPYTGGNAIYNKNISFVKEIMPEGYDNMVYGYMAGNVEFDKAMEYLLQRLEEAGKLENTVIVIAGDHYPYNLSDKARNQLVGYEMDSNFDIYKSTCIIYNAGMEENIVSDTYCSNVDILPTILNLFGIRFDSRLFMGRDVFAGGIHKAVLYNMSFVTDMVRYNSKTGETVWTDKAMGYTEEIRENYLESMIELIKSEYYASLKILSTNFYEYAWVQSGLLSDEELKAERERVAQVKKKDAAYNASDAAANEKWIREQEAKARAAEEAERAKQESLEAKENQNPPESQGSEEPEKQEEPQSTNQNEELEEKNE